MIFKTGTSSFTVRSRGVICDILMIGGGGSGGYWGGGGAGACIVAIGHILPSGVCNVTVGAGGGGESSISVNGTTLYLAKGGGHGSSDNNGNPGGCGGGAGHGWESGWESGFKRSGGNFVSTNFVNTSNGVINTGPTIQPTYAVFGNNGGDQEDIATSSSNSIWSCPGGGGIGAAGGNHYRNTLTAGLGGGGLNGAIINGIPYNFQSYFANNNTFGHNNGYIGGGGAGKADKKSSQTFGGVGGGGKGSANLDTIKGTPGAANTGSGGGGGDFSGGSGIVIIRYKEDCPVDCAGDWDTWTVCAATCDGINTTAPRTGTRTRTYRVTRPVSNGGRTCPIADNITETDNTCSKTDCPVHCVGDWGNWTACAATCDGNYATAPRTGTRTRTYRVTRPVSNGGRTCPIADNIIETDNTCSKTDCQVDCVGNWSVWNACVATCDGNYATAPRAGTRIRTYRVTRPISNGGRTCPIADNTTETDITCSKTDCSVDCVGNWDTWTACAATCDGINTTAPRTGTRTRTYRVTRLVSNGGRTCPIADNITETDNTCSKTDCSVDCSGSWGTWTHCAATCDGNYTTAPRTGTRTRTYRVTRPVGNGGRTCPIADNITETDNTCSKTDCSVDCSGNWDTWTACTATCDGINTIAPRAGTRTRTYRVTRPVSNGGRTCPTTDNITETDNTCSKIDCLVNCVGNWDTWTACTATCDGNYATAPRTGTRTRTYRITRPVSNGGRTCPIADNITETDITCSKTDCQVDCSWNWGNWSECSAIAGQRSITGTIGQRTGTFNRTINPLNGGRTCPVPPYIQNCIIPPPISDISGTDISGNITNSTDKFMIFTTGTSSFTVRSGGVICDILMIGGGGAGGFYGGGGGAGACIVAIGHTIPGGVCNVTVGPGSATYAPMWTGNGYTVGSPGGDSSISVDGTTLYLAKGGGAGGSYFNNGNPGGCGGGGGYGSYGTRLGGDVRTNIVNTSNGVINTGPTMQPQLTYVVFGNKGGDQLDTTLNKSIYTGAGGGGIGAAAPNHALGDLAAGPGGAGLNDATINGITYNFKSYFANNYTFGDISGYIGGGGAGMSRNNSTQADGGVGGGGKGAVLSPEGTSRATSGAANTGSGGGSADEYRISGGSGIVIIRYRS
jgi:hypothetical protein